MRLDDVEVAPAFLDRVPISFARRHKIVGCTHPGGGIDLYASLSSSRDAVDALARMLPSVHRILRASSDAVLARLNAAYERQTGQADAAISDLKYDQSSSELLRHLDIQTSGGEDLLEGEGRAPVVKLVNALLFEATQHRASDIHIQPTERESVVRTRIDGVLFDAHHLPRSVHDELVSRVKVMARMNIAEKRLPQDGRATVRVGTRQIDLRVSTVPTSFGERVVFRLLDKSARLYSLNELGMPPATLASFSRMVRMEHGLILVTGPTGSGKSTTLYGVLQQLKTTELNVLTLEDPIEYQLPGISQMQVAERKGMSFAKGLRSVLRQDPDIIMVGEIRDKETAELAIQAALTGHLVFSTLHTNDAASAVTRLLDLGIEPYLVASSLRAVMAQRLVRRVCRECANHPPDTVLRYQLRQLGLDPDDCDLSSTRVGSGCPACRDTGYRGRVGIFEYLPLSDAVRELIQERCAASSIKRAAVAEGLNTLREDGIAKVLNGQTTAEEVVRVTLAVDATELEQRGATRRRGEA